MATSADSYAAKAKVDSSCTSPKTIRSTGAKDFVLETTGKVWSRKVAGAAATPWTSVTLKALGVADGGEADSWVSLALGPADGLAYVASAFGKVVRVKTDGTEEELIKAKWFSATIIGLEFLSDASGHYAYTLDYLGAVHVVPVDGQDPAAFPSLYPAPYYYPVAIELIRLPVEPEPAREPEPEIPGVPSAIYPHQLNRNEVLRRCLHREVPRDESCSGSKLVRLTTQSSSGQARPASEAGTVVPGDRRE